MIRRLDLNNKTDRHDLIRLQRLSYAVEAGLIGFDKIPPLREDQNSLKKSNEIFFGYFITGHKLVAAIAYLKDGTTLDICRLVVSPDHFQKGYASALLRFIEKEERNIHKIIVSAAKKNIPALNLYYKYGYQRIGNKLVEGELEIINLEKDLNRSF